MKRVMIATPAYDGRVDIHFADSLARSIKAASAKDIDIIPVYWPGEAILFHARNELFKIAHSAQVDDMVWIDSDQGWEPSDLLKLLSYQVDVVGAPVRKKTLDDELYNVRSSNPFIHVDANTGLLIIDGLGTGMLRLSCTAINDLWNFSDPYEKDGRSCRLVFENTISSGKLTSEDNVLCDKLKDLGYRIYLDAEMVCTHFGTTVFSGDFSAWLKKLQSSS